jgi:hypothetical protein
MRRRSNKQQRKTKAAQRDLIIAPIVLQFNRRATRATSRIIPRDHDARPPAYEWLIKEAALGTRKLLLH